MQKTHWARPRARGLLAVGLTVAAFVVANFASATDAAAKSRHHHRPRYEGIHHKPHTPLHPTQPSILGVQILDEKTGATVVSINPTDLFNPASNTKLATALAVLRKLGAEYRFKTEISYSGTIDGNGELQGDLYISGNYVLFGDAEVYKLGNILRDKGIKSVNGDLVVSSDFSLDAEATGTKAGGKVVEILKEKRYKINIKGQVNLGAPPANATVIATHVSPPLKHVLKRMLCPSDNEMAHRFGDMIGGPQGLTQFLVNDLGVPAAEASFASTSGLYVNRLSPPAMMKVLIALKAELAKDNLTFADIMPVSGIDTGTMNHRLNSGRQRGSVVAKTGTLPETDDGASALSGEMHTKSGSFLFVIFEMHGSVGSFKGHENDRVTNFQDAHGGAKPIVYKPILPGFESESSWQ